MNVITMHGTFFSVFPPFFFLLERFLPSGPDKKGLSTSNLEYDKSQTIYFPPRNSGANFTESVFVIDNYSGSSIDWQTK